MAYDKKAKKAYKKAKKAARRYRRKSNSLVKTIKQVIARQAENKKWFDYGANVSLITAANSVPVSRNLVPTIAQGVSKHQRIGNEVRVKSGVIKGYCNVMPYNSLTNPLPLPLYVKMWLVSYKIGNFVNLSSTDIASNFFDLNGGVAPLQGSMLDCCFNVNSESWTVHKTKTIKLGCGYVSATGPVSTGSYFDNSPMSVPFSFNFGKKLNLVKYNDASNVPTNKNLFLIWQPVTADGQSSNFYVPAEVHYTTNISYEDL